MKHANHFTTDLPSYRSPMFSAVLLSRLQELARDTLGCSQVVLIVVAHPDDESLGPGCTIRLLRSQPGVAVVIVVLAAEDPIRRAESMRAARTLDVAEDHVFLFDFPDGYLEDEAEAVRRVLQMFADVLAPDLVVAHKHDDHLDHSLVHAAVNRVFAARHTSIINFRIPQRTWSHWAPDVWFRVDGDAGQFKTDVLYPVYASEHAKGYYFGADMTRGELELHGHIAGCRCSEAFEAVQLFLGNCPYKSGSIVVAPNAARRVDAAIVAPPPVRLPVRISRLVFEPCPCGCGRIAVARNSVGSRTAARGSTKETIRNATER
jgi:LmbE family N-acetylglucosaminyl deacetylase